jgi:hypothetical protein
VKQRVSGDISMQFQGARGAVGAARQLSLQLNSFARNGSLSEFLLQSSISCSGDTAWEKQLQQQQQQLSSSSSSAAGSSSRQQQSC